MDKPIKIKGCTHELKSHEYLILPEQPHEGTYEIFLNGKKLKDVTGVIRTTLKNY